MGAMPHQKSAQSCSPLPHLNHNYQSYLRLGIHADQKCARVSGASGRTRAGKLDTCIVTLTGAVCDDVSNVVEKLIWHIDGTNLVL